MINPNTFDRIVSYFHALASEPFVYKGKSYRPYDRLVISPIVFRSYVCGEGCGACCMKCSLVWDEKVFGNLAPVELEINSIRRLWWADDQRSNPSPKCSYLDGNGRCEIYKTRPFACRFELFKFAHFVSRGSVYARVAKPGRYTKLRKVDGEKGAICQLASFRREFNQDYIDCLLQIKEWMAGFGIRNHADTVVDYLHTGPHEVPLVIYNSKKREGL